MLEQVSSFLVLIYPRTLADVSQFQSISDAVKVIVGVALSCVERNCPSYSCYLAHEAQQARASFSASFLQAKPPYPDCRTRSARQPDDNLGLKIAYFVSILFYFENILDNARETEA